MPRKRSHSHPRPSRLPSARSALLRTLTLLLALALGYTILRAVFGQSRFTEFDLKRANKRAGDRESWFVKEKWEHPAGVLRRASRPECKSIMLLRMGEGGGDWSGVLWSMVRAQVVADKLGQLRGRFRWRRRSGADETGTNAGYTLLIDDTDWTIGTWRTYFDPIELSCEPPLDWAWPEPRARVGKQGWEARNRVWLSTGTSSEQAMDEYIRDHMMDGAALDAVRAAASTMEEVSGRLSLPADETLPPKLVPVFELFADAFRRLWRLNDAVELLVIDERHAFQLGKGKDNGSGSGRPVVVAMQVDDGLVEHQGAEDSSKLGRRDRLKRLLHWHHLLMILG